MTTVYWTPMLTQGDKNMNEADIIFEEPKPLMKELLSAYKNRDFMKCPSVQSYCKNVFVIPAPMDATINVRSGENNSISMQIDGSGWDQVFYDSFCELREDATVSLPPVYLFFTKQSLEIESLPVFLLNSASTENVLPVPGGFDIGKWIRPVDFTFVLKDASKPIRIRRGDPLFFVRFKTSERVEFKRVEFTPELGAVVSACVRVKKRVPNLALPVLYAMAKARLSLFLRKVKE